MSGPVENTIKFNMRNNSKTKRIRIRFLAEKNILKSKREMAKVRRSIIVPLNRRRVSREGKMRRKKSTITMFLSECL